MKHYCVKCGTELYRKSKTGCCGMCFRTLRKGTHHSQETKEKISKTKKLLGQGRNYCRCEECGKEIRYGTKSNLCLICYKKQTRMDFSNVEVNGIKFKEYIKQENGYQIWLLECFCGTEFINNASRIKTGIVKSCGCSHIEHCKRLGNSQRGENNPAWIKDRTKTSLFIRKSGNWKRNNKGSWQYISRKVKEKQNFTCQLTNERCNSYELASHHIESVVLRPDLAYEINNIIVIKKEIHILFHKLYGKKTSSVEWNKFLTNEFLTIKGTA